MDTAHKKNRLTLATFNNQSRAAISREEPVRMENPSSARNRWRLKGLPRTLVIIGFHQERPHNVSVTPLYKRIK